MPFVPELSIYTATEVTPLWQATGEWLGAHGVDVPFWCVPWAGGQGLARWVLDHPHVVKGKRVLDFGSGSGLVALAAARAGASSVRAVDIDPLAEAASHLNAEANGLSIEAECRNVVDTRVEGIDVLLTGDVWYDGRASQRFAPWLTELVTRGMRVVTGDPARLYVPRNVRELARYEIPTPLELESANTRTTRILELMQASEESTVAAH